MRIVTFFEHRRAAVVTRGAGANQAPVRARSRFRPGRGCGSGSRRPGSRSPTTRGCDRRRRSAAASPRCLRAGPGCRSGRRRRWCRGAPSGESGGRGRRPSGQSPSIEAAAVSSRSKLQSQGVTGMPPLRGRRTRPRRSIRIRPCQADAPSQTALASRSASSVSLFPGTRIVGVSIAARGAIVSARPSWTERRSQPAPITDVGVGRQLDKFGRLLEVAVKVAEGEDFHRANLHRLRHEVFAEFLQLTSAMRRVV